jgi:hypothetical protein
MDVWSGVFSLWLEDHRESLFTTIFSFFDYLDSSDAP